MAPKVTNPGIAKANAEAEAVRAVNTTRTNQAELATRDLAAEFAPREPTEAEIATRFQKGNPSRFGKTKDPTTGKFVAGQGRTPGSGRKKGGNNQAVKAIKDFMVELLDDEHYRMTLVRRIKAGELPGVELFLLTKALGKPKEEIEITANVPLFSLPTSFLMKEDVVEAESTRLLGEGDENGGNKVRE